MNLYPLPGALPPGPGPVDTGWARVIRHGPMTAGEVLERGRAQMEAEDEAEAYARDPVGWLRAERRRRTLFGRLFGR